MFKRSILNIELHIRYFDIQPEIMEHDCTFQKVSLFDDCTVFHFDNPIRLIGKSLVMCYDK
jgi:hypothetical protein